MALAVESDQQAVECGQQAVQHMLFARDLYKHQHGCKAQAVEFSKDHL